MGDNTYKKYADDFELFISKGPADIESLYATMSVNKNTIVKYLNIFLKKNPSKLSYFLGFMPNAEVIIKKTTEQIGLINGKNLIEANNTSKLIVESIIKPKHTEFVNNLFKKSNNNEEFIDAITSDYLQYVIGSGNSLVTIAGEINELLLLESLRNIGLEEKTGYFKKGRGDTGDIQINTTNLHNTSQLYCEVKSYYARERLHRALKKINGQKIGAGFFIDPKEFNQNHTKTLLSTGALAVYMPAPTLSELTLKVREAKTTNNNTFYRSLERFPNDMKFFNTHGVLPVE